MKYIVFQVEGPDGLHVELPIIFPDMLVHRFVAQALVPMIRARHGLGVTPVSAGSVNIHAFSCSGESETLKLKSRPQDRDLIANLAYTHGLVDPLDYLCVCGHPRRAHTKEDGSGGCATEVGMDGCRCRAFRHA